MRSVTSHTHPLPEGRRFFDRFDYGKRGRGFICGHNRCGLPPDDLYKMLHLRHQQIDLRTGKSGGDDGIDPMACGVVRFFCVACPFVPR